MSSIFVFACALILWAEREKRRLLEQLMARHEANMRCGDPEKVIEARSKWLLMCRQLQASERMYDTGLDLERWGERLAKEVE
jgi:hypothetical protein